MLEPAALLLKMTLSSRDPIGTVNFLAFLWVSFGDHVFLFGAIRGWGRHLGSGGRILGVALYH